MKNNLIRFIFLFICVLIACGLSACQDKTVQSIKFYRESKASSLNNNTRDQKDVLKKSSGVIIYKDNSQKKGPSLKTIDFGPKDIDFDLPIKFK